MTLLNTIRFEVDIDDKNFVITKKNLFTAISAADG